MDFGTCLQQRRKALDLTQEALARQVGRSVAAVRKIEADERRPSQQAADLWPRRWTSLRPTARPS